MNSHGDYTFLFERLVDPQSDFQERPFLQLPLPQPPHEDPTTRRDDEKPEEVKRGVIIIDI